MADAETFDLALGFLKKLPSLSVDTSDDANKLPSPYVFATSVWKEGMDESLDAEAVFWKKLNEEWTFPFA